MNEPALQPSATSPGPAGAASRLVAWGAGGLSVLLVLALALAAGVPAGRLLATVSGGGGAQGDLERAVAPQIVERQARRAQQERPVTVGVRSLAAVARIERSITLSTAALTSRPEIRLNESLLALPPPAQA